MILTALKTFIFQIKFTNFSYYFCFFYIFVASKYKTISQLFWLQNINQFNQWTSVEFVYHWWYLPPSQRWPLYAYIADVIYAVCMSIINNNNKRSHGIFGSVLLHRTQNPATCSGVVVIINTFFNHTGENFVIAIIIKKVLLLLKIWALNNKRIF